ncbi:hypothetical protein JCM5296_000038 [Sporobolomyces johnsonii]
MPPSSVSTTSSSPASTASTCSLKKINSTKWVLSKDAREEIDTEVVTAFHQIPSWWEKWMPHPFTHFGWMTAEDLSNFILVIGPIALYKHLPTSYYMHFLLLRQIVLRIMIHLAPQHSPGGRPYRQTTLQHC